MVSSLDHKSHVPPGLDSCIILTLAGLGTRQSQDSERRISLDSREELFWIGLLLRRVVTSIRTGRNKSNQLKGGTRYGIQGNLDFWETW